MTSGSVDASTMPARHCRDDLYDVINVGGAQYTQMVSPFVNNIASTLQSFVSSSSFYFEASDSATLQSSMQTLLYITLQQAAHCRCKTKWPTLSHRPWAVIVGDRTR
jgi:hypothetical protein